MTLLFDPDLGVAHTPPFCDSEPLKTGDGRARDCVDRTCSAAACNYSLALASPQAYTLQVHTKLFSSAGADATLAWTYLRCSASEYAVLSGLDTVTCHPVRPAPGFGRQDVERLQGGVRVFLGVCVCSVCSVSVCLCVSVSVCQCVECETWGCVMKGTGTGSPHASVLIRQLWCPHAVSRWR